MLDIDRKWLFRHRGRKCAPAERYPVEPWRTANPRHGAFHDALALGARTSASTVRRAWPWPAQP